MNWAYVVDGSVIEELGGNNLFDDFLKDLFSEIFGGYLLGVLSRNNDSVYAERDGGTTFFLVLNGNLSLRIGAEPAKFTRAACSSHGGVELVGEHDGQGHVFLGLIGGITEHDTLVTSTVVLERTMVQTLSNVGRLLLDGYKDIAGLVVETFGGIVISDLFDGLSDNLLIVKLGFSGDFAEHHDHAGFRRSLASNLGRRVLCEAGIELNASVNMLYQIQRSHRAHTMASETWSQILSDGVSWFNKISTISGVPRTRVTLANRLRGEQEVARGKGGTSSFSVGGHYFTDGECGEKER